MVKVSRRGARQLKMQAVENGKPVPKELQQAWLLDASDRFRARQSLEQQRVQRVRSARRAHHLAVGYERDSIKRAVLAVEHRLVEAMWVLARLPSQSARGFSRRNGIDYMLEKADRYGNAVANGGAWDSPTPKPPVPSAKSIDAMYDPLAWLSWLGRIDGKFVAAAAASKQGKTASNVSWRFVRTQVPEVADLSLRSLQHRYAELLRELVAELTFRSAVNALAD